MINVDYPIIDGDGHVVEPDKEMAEYLPERFRRIPGNREYSLFPQDAWAFGVVDPHKQDVPDAAMWLSFLDEAGISATVLYPSNAAAVGMVRRVEWSVDLARAYNDWLYDKFLRQSGRLLGVALLPVHDVGACVTELRRCVGELGFVGAILPSISSPLMAYGNPEFDPIYATAAELDTMIAVHGGFVGAHNFADPFRTYREVRALKHVIPLMSHATSMISQGVFDRYPNLRVAYLEAGCGWVPYLMDVLDEQFERKGAGDLKRRPSEYLMDPNVYFSFEIEERTLPFFIQLLGDEKLVWPSDYPHERSRAEFFSDLPEFFAREDVSADSKRKILSENPRRLYRLQEISRGDLP